MALHSTKNFDRGQPDLLQSLRYPRPARQRAKRGDHLPHRPCICEFSRCQTRRDRWRYASVPGRVKSGSGQWSDRRWLCRNLPVHDRHRRSLFCSLPSKCRRRNRGDCQPQSHRLQWHEAGASRRPADQWRYRPKGHPAPGRDGRLRTGRSTWHAGSPVLPGRLYRTPAQLHQPG